MERDENATLMIGDQMFPVNAESILKLVIYARENKKVDPLAYCPSCRQNNHDPQERNYRRRAWRYVKKYLVVSR